MAYYIGFTTKNACKPRSTNAQVNNLPNTTSSLPTGYGGVGLPIIPGKKFTLTDANLVIQDFINAINIPQGSIVGKPQYGTTLWTFLFEPNTVDLQIQIENEIRRVASLDPRLDINLIKTYPQSEGILVELQLSVVPFNQEQFLSVFFSEETNQATIL